MTETLHSPLPWHLRHRLIWSRVKIDRDSTWGPSIWISEEFVSDQYESHDEEFKQMPSIVTGLSLDIGPWLKPEPCSTYSPNA